MPLKKRLFEHYYWPHVTCICPTYGRHDKVRDAIASFLSQGYPGMSTLVIGNDAPTPLVLYTDDVGEPQYEYEYVATKKAIRIVNSDEYEQLSNKKQSLLDNAETDFIAHWEDDDIYLPWHLEYGVGKLLDNEDMECVKYEAAWRMRDPKYVPSPKWKPLDIRTGRYDGQMIFRAGTSVPYKVGNRSIELPLIMDYHKRNKIIHHPNPPFDAYTYVYRIYDGLKHLCRSGKADAKAGRLWKEKNVDFGNGYPLIPYLEDNYVDFTMDRLEVVYMKLLEFISKLEDRDKEFGRFTRRLSTGRVGMYFEKIGKEC